jgi:hypothetical protein
MDNQLLNHLYLGIFSRAEQSCCGQYSKRLQTVAVNVSPQSQRSPAIQVRANGLSAIRLLKRCALASSRSGNGDVTQPCHSPTF